MYSQDFLVHIASASIVQTSVLFFQDIWSLGRPVSKTSAVARGKQLVPEHQHAFSVGSWAVWVEEFHKLMQESATDLRASPSSTAEICKPPFHREGISDLPQICKPPFHHGGIPACS